MNGDTRDVVTYFTLVILLTVPFWLGGHFLRLEILPGMPAAAAAVLCPALAAVLLTFRSSGRSGLFKLLARTLDASRTGWRLVPIVLINPILFTLAFVIARLSGKPIPNPDISAAHALLLVALFLPTAMLEELGWTGFALDRLEARLGPRLAGLALGLFWAIWHYPALIEVGRSAAWIGWWSLWTLSARVVMVRIYYWSGRSLFAMVLYHAPSNLCWQFYPENGSWFDPKISGLITFTLAIILFLGGSARKKAAPEACETKPGEG